MTPLYLQQCAQRVEKALTTHFNLLDKIQQKKSAASPALIQAMRYGTLGGGKRIRAALVYAAAESCEQPLAASAIDDLACSIELIHAYSLIHDDLPAMDNDSYRRGNPSCHIRFGEGIAILAGDTLQVYAFELLANNKQIPPQLRLDIIDIIAKAIGISGMAGGQSMDIITDGQNIDEDYVRRTHLAKTAQLIKASVLIGAIVESNASNWQSLVSFAEHIGLCFQIKDDLLDHSPTAAKKQANDQGVNYVTAVGLKKTNKIMQALYKQAIMDLNQWQNTQSLMPLAEYTVNRTV